MLVKVYKGTKEVDWYSDVNVACIITLTGKEIKESDATFKKQKRMRVYDDHAYLAIFDTAGVYNLYTSDCRITLEGEKNSLLQVVK